MKRKGHRFRRAAWLPPGLLLLSLLAGAAGASVRDSTARAEARAASDIAPKMACQQLVGLDLSRLPDAPTMITYAAVVPATAQKAAYCQVKGYVSPQVAFEVRLPVDTFGGTNNGTDFAHRVGGAPDAGGRGRQAPPADL